MQKKVGFLILIIAITGCSVSRFGKPDMDKNVETGSGVFNKKKILNNNLTSYSFFIQKAEVEVYSGNEIQKFLANIKFSFPDTYLISLRSNTGIEAARIFLTGDTMLVNDRINKIIYCGNSYGVRKKYGFVQALLPLLWGDIVLSRNYEENDIKCLKGSAQIDEVISGFKVAYKINCDKAKVEMVVLTGSNNQQNTIISNESYKKIGNGYVVEKSNVTGFNNYDLIKLKYSKIEVPWEGKIEFIPGKNYEKVEIK